MEQPEIIDLRTVNYGEIAFTEEQLDSFRPMSRARLFEMVENCRPIATHHEAYEIVNAIENYIKDFPRGVKPRKPTRETMLKAMVELLETTAKAKSDFVQVAEDCLKIPMYQGDENVIRRVQRIAQIEMMKLSIQDLDKIREDLNKVLALNA